MIKLPHVHMTAERCMLGVEGGGGGGGMNTSQSFQFDSRQLTKQIG